MKVEIKLEVLTPLFLAGAIQQQTELRAASIKGELRYWLRAVLGGIIGDQNLSLLAELEANVFGDTGFSSPVIIRLAQHNEKQGDAPLRPNRSGNDAASARAFLPGTTFHLILSLSPRGSAKQLEMATWSALLWLTLGGLGRRSRRGEGSVRVKELIVIPDDFSTKLKETLQLAVKRAEDAQQLAGQVEIIVNNARQEFLQFAAATTPNLSARLPAFSILQADTRIIVKQPDDEEPLVWLMQTMSALKRTLESTRFAEAFGGIGPDNFGGERRADRRASPLHVTVHQTQSGPALLFTYLAAKILAHMDGQPEEGYKLLDDLKGFPVKLTGGER